MNCEEMQDIDTQALHVSETIQDQVNNLATKSQSLTEKSSSEKSTSTQLDSLDPKKFFWNEDEEIYMHVKGMCFDPLENVYFNYINPDEDNLKPLYYRQLNEN